MTHIYGIPNCNSVKKALDWFNQHEIPFTFHNFKKEGVSAAKLKNWLKMIGKEALVNKKGTTWRSLTQEEQSAVSTQAGTLTLLAEKTSIIKRPLIEWANGAVTTGFNEEVFTENI